MGTQNKKTKPYLIFDLDGTLYQFKGGSFNNSELKKMVMSGAIKFIADRLDVSQKKAYKVLKNITKKYNEDISVGLEELYGIDCYEYFNEVWNIPAKDLVTYNRETKKILTLLKKKFNLILISDAPLIWVENALKVLKIRNIFGDKIFSGEGDMRKVSGNVFKYIIKKLKIKTANCVIIGDQESTDIVPAKKMGLKAILIGKKNNYTIADYKISNLKELLKIL